ncbi:MAG: tetratricopeptide repeat protein [Fibrobacter sp.]|jgi:tetratricopeptide (TPR) repeat protein|nr:tetratricopeptide repeat protein [Fibrobacter sp.]
MNRTALGFQFLPFLLCCTIHSFLYAEKVIVYDPVKGIIFVDKNEAEKQKKNTSSTSVAKKQKKSSSADLHIGRKKDPPELYFKSGLEYFKNGDYKNALKNFSYADSVAPSPQSMLWKAKTYRQMGDFDKMLFIMQQIIENFPDSDVADDALFELALHYQKIDDYERASLLYTRLTEQYPFGLLFSTGEELREIAREQKKLMRAELINLLSILGFSGDELTVNIRSFQKSNNMEITGSADQKTVQMIRTRHTEFLHEEQKQLLEQNKRKKSSVMLLGAAAVSVFILGMLILLRLKINTKKQHIAELRKIITDLDLSKL